MPHHQSLLLTFVGADRPGLTGALFSAVGDCDVAVQDLEQVVIRGRLVLGVLLIGPDCEAAAERMTGAAEDLGLSVTSDPGASAEDPRRRGRIVVTVLGRPMTPGALAAVAGGVADHGANIDRIVRLASYPVTGIELEISGADTESLRADLARRAPGWGVDIAVSPGGLARRGVRLVVMDVDSTLIQQEVIELLAAEAGADAEAAVAEITAAAMRGELDFAESLTARVQRLAGLSEDVLDRVRERVELAPGARTLIRTLKRMGYRVGIVSGGFSQITDALAAELGLDFAAANTLEVVEGRLTGRLIGPLVDRAGKAEALRRFAATAGVPLDQTVAIGDGANDLDMLAAAGLGIAFNAKPVVRDAADAAVSVPFLDSVLYLLGITRDDVESADAAAGFPTPAPPLQQP
jgi:phosphoserine phosphatase